MEPLDLEKKKRELDELIAKQERAKHQKGSPGASSQSQETKKPTPRDSQQHLVPQTPENTALQAELFAREVLRPELNFAKFADFIFISPYSSKVRQTRTKNWNTVLADGEAMPASLKIEPLQDHKTPTTTTYKYFLALIQLWEEQGKPIDGKILFSSRDVANVLNLKWSGTVSDQLERELAILDSAKFTWEWSFLDEENEKKALVQRMNILTNSTYIKGRIRRKKEKFTPLHTVTFHEHIVQNLIAGVTKPVNFHTILSIKNEGAAALYTHLDIILSSKPYWERTASNLIGDLHLTGERYHSKRTRRAKLEEWRKALDGKLLSHGKLSLSVQETKSGDDWKLVARKIPQKTKNRFPKSPANTPELRQELLELIGGVIGGMETHKRLYGLFVASYDHSIIRQAVSEYKADIVNPREPQRVFTAIIHRIAHLRGKEWIKDCGKNCKYRPENLLL